MTHEEAAKHVMEGADPEFAAKIQPGDLIVAGKNFGCGSSRESAPGALKHAGIGAVVAPYFARIFYRNAINLGLPVLECDRAREIRQGDELEIELERGEIRNLTSGQTYRFNPYPEQVLNIMEAGGLLPMLRREVESKKQWRGRQI